MVLSVRMMLMMIPMKPVVVDMGHGYPQRRIIMAHQGIAQQADSTIRVGQGLTLPTPNRLAVSYKDSTCNPALHLYKEEPGALRGDPHDPTDIT